MTIFSTLSKEEVDTLMEAPALVTILIGAADGKLDGEEHAWSERLLRSRSYAGMQALQAYYGLVSEIFWVTLRHEMTALPKDIAARNSLISTRLAALNPILAKLDNKIAYGLYKGMLGLAEETAKASGGFLRIGAVAAVEQEWVTLPMLTPVAKPASVKDEAERFDENIWGEKPER